MKNKKSGIIGIGLDNKDGHKRLTKADRFVVAGGSEETHERLTATLCKTFEDLKRKGKDLDDAKPEEVRDLIEKNASDF